MKIVGLYVFPPHRAVYRRFCLCLGEVSSGKESEEKLR